jgi:hypothetical protein
MEREIIFSKKVELYLDELMLLLFEEGYFGFPDSAKSEIYYLSCQQKNIMVYFLSGT